MRCYDEAQSVMKGGNRRKKKMKGREVLTLVWIQLPKMLFQCISGALKKKENSATGDDFFFSYVDATRSNIMHYPFFLRAVA